MKTSKLSGQSPNQAPFYKYPHQFEPLLPQKRLDEIFSLAQQITSLALKLHGQLHPTTAIELKQLLRAMNSYYSNKIEGHSTHPLNIERSLKHDFSHQPKIARLQRLALAHIEAEIEIESWVDQGSFSAFTVDGIRRIHEALYRRLPAKERKTVEGEMQQPGEWRTKDVVVGRHIPPIHTSLPGFLKRFEEAYHKTESWDRQLIKIASAHQRLAWIHPFLDGNGRVTRLASHAALYRDFTGGLWSICRGLARTQRDYYARLELADEPRRGDLDGRGNLSESGLWEFCHYFLQVCLDQVSFMTKLLDLDGLRDRIRALIILRSQENKLFRLEAALPLHYLLSAGSMTRGEFKQMTGLHERLAQSLLSQLLKTGLVKTDSPLGPVRFGMPLDALQFYFPDLYPEATTKPEEM